MCSDKYFGHEPWKALRRKECCDKVAASNVVTLSCDRSGRVAWGQGKGHDYSRTWENMGFHNDGVEYRKPHYNQIDLYRQATTRTSSLKDYTRQALLRK
jgi:hypothetical protein